MAGSGVRRFRRERRARRRYLVAHGTGAERYWTGHLTRTDSQWAAHQDGARVPGALSYWVGAQQQVAAHTLYRHRVKPWVSADYGSGFTIMRQHRISMSPVTIHGHTVWFSTKGDAIAFAAALETHGAYNAYQFSFCLIHPDCWATGEAMMRSCRDGRRTVWSND